MPDLTNMGIRVIIRLFLIIGITGLFALSNCEECDECGPSSSETYVNLKFFNIDSLNKINVYLADLQDTLFNLDEEIANGNEGLVPVRDSIQNVYDYYLSVTVNIKNGKIKVNEVYGMNGFGPIYFTDSTTNDSLVNFRFPIDMNNDVSSFIIHINGFTDTLKVQYNRRNTMDNYTVLLEAVDLSLVEHTYDSVRIICNLDSCNSAQTRIYAYF